MLAHSGASSFKGVLQQSWLPLLVSYKLATEIRKGSVAARFSCNLGQETLGFEQVEIWRQVRRVDVQGHGHLTMARPFSMIIKIRDHEAHQFDLPIGRRSEIPWLGVHA